MVERTNVGGHGGRRKKGRRKERHVSITLSKGAVPSPPSCPFLTTFFPCLRVTRTPPPHATSPNMPAYSSPAAGSGVAPRTPTWQAWTTNTLPPRRTNSSGALAFILRACFKRVLPHSSAAYRGGLAYPGRRSPPPATSSGARLRISSRGAPNVRAVLVAACSTSTPLSTRSNARVHGALSYPLLTLLFSIIKRAR